MFNFEKVINILSEKAKQIVTNYLENKISYEDFIKEFYKIRIVTRQLQILQYEINKLEIE